MYKSYRMSNTEQVATVGPQMVVGTRYWNEVAAATYFLIEVAAATSYYVHSVPHSLCCNQLCSEASSMSSLGLIDR